MARNARVATISARISIASCSFPIREKKSPLLPTHVENADPETSKPGPVRKPLPEIPSTPPPPRVIIPSLPTLEKAVAARIYFENLYFAILRKRPSREERRRALETELAVMKIGPEAKQEIRDRWLQNETEYLRDRRAKVDPSAFIKLKTIGHGEHFPPSCFWF